MAKNDELKPLPRTGDLTPVGAAYTGAPTIDDPSEQGVLAWAEALRDEFERKHKLLTVKGLVRTARALGYGGDIIKNLKTVYAEEYAAEQAGGDGAATPAPKKTAKAEAKPSKNGKAEKPEKAPKEKKPAKDKPEPTRQKINNKTNIPVEVTRSEGGRANVLIHGHPMRGVLRWMGSDGWSGGEASYALAMLGLTEEAGVVGEKMTLESVIRDHVACGRHGEQGWHGPPAQVGKEEIKALRALREKVLEKYPQLTEKKKAKAKETTKPSKNVSGKAKVKAKNGKKVKTASA